MAKRVSLLQNGQVFESIIKAQAGSPLASSATSSVSSVTVESPAQAKVVYSILVGGSPALKNQPGVAVFQGGIWKVGDQSFCALLTLENSGKAPAACPAPPASRPVDPGSVIQARSEGPEGPVTARYGGRSLALAVLCTLLFLTFLDNTVVSVALGSVQTTCTQGSPPCSGSSGPTR